MLLRTGRVGNFPRCPGFELFNRAHTESFGRIDDGCRGCHMGPATAQPICHLVGRILLVPGGPAVGGSGNGIGGKAVEQHGSRPTGKPRRAEERDRPRYMLQPHLTGSDRAAARLGSGGAVEASAPNFEPWKQWNPSRGQCAIGYEESEKKMLVDGFVV